MNLTFSQSFSKAQQLNGVSLPAFVASIAVSILAFGTQVLFYCMIRRYVPDIYGISVSGSRLILRDLVKNLCSSLWRFNFDDDHLDRLFFRRYIRTMCMIFVPAAVLVCPILIPINYTHGKSTATGGVSGLDTFGWSNVGLNHADRFWAHLLIGWLFIGFVCVVIWIELAYYVQILQVSRHRDICTILVEAIPRDYMTAESIKQCFSIFPGKVIGVAINEDMGRITSLALHRTALARRLELAETIRLQKAVGSCAQARGLRGSLETYIHKLLSCRLQERDPRMHLHDELRALDVRYGVELSGDIDRKRLPSAFVTFENPASAHMACQTVMNIRPGHMTPRTLVPSIDDIMWNNVNKSLLSRTLRTALSNTLILSIALICAIPVAFAGLLSQIIYLTEAVPWLGWVNELPRWSLGLIQGVLPSTILAVFIGVYATILEPLVDIQGITSHAAVSLRIQDFYFCFLFIQTTLLVSLSAGLTTIANEVGHGASLVMVLAKNLPKASNYFLSYILLQALSSSSNALLRSDLLLVKFVISPLLDKTVTQMMERNNRLFDIKLGTFIPFFTNLSCIGILYAIISPIILPFQGLVFLLFWFVYCPSTFRWTSRDERGAFYPRAVKHLLAGVYFMEMSLMILFLLVRDSRGRAMCLGQACFMVMSLGLTAVYHHILARTFDPLIAFCPHDPGRKLQTPAPVDFNASRLQTLDRTYVINLPLDPDGRVHHTAADIRRSVGVPVSDKDATMNAAGRIKLNK